MIPYFKYSDTGSKCVASPLYTGEFDDKFFKLKFHDEFWFNRETQYLNILSTKDYTPKIVYIDIENKEILLEINGKNLNHMLHDNDTLPADWKEQINFIVEDLKADNIFKINLYPHTFCVSDGKLKIIDFYACGNQNDSVSYDVVEDIINDKDRFNFIDGYLDVEATYKNTIKNQRIWWPEDVINE